MDETNAVLRAVEQVVGPSVRAEPRPDRDAVDVEIDVGSHTVRLRAVWLARGWPADVRTALDQHGDAQLFVAPVFSVGSRKLLGDRRVNWVDATGAADLRAEGLIVSVSGPSVASDPQERVARWGPLAVAAGEAVLSRRPERITVGWLADHAQCSMPRAGQILQGWDNEGWTAKHGPARGRNAFRGLERPGALLDSWAAHVAEERLTRWFAHSTERDLERLRGQVSEALEGLSAAWTGWVAGDLMAPFTTQVPVLHLRVGQRHSRLDVREALAAASVRLTEDAGRVELWLTDDRAFAYLEEHEGQRTCSWPRVYADLLRIGSRGADAAGHLRDVMGSGL